MTRILSCTTALALLLTAPAALAEVTPEEVWGNWQAFAAMSGQGLTFENVTLDADTLVVTNLVSNFDNEMGTTGSATIPEMRFVGNADGTVSVTMSESYPLTLAFPDDTGGTTTLKVTVSHPGLTILASGTAEAMSYDFKAPVIAGEVDEVLLADGQVEETDGTLSINEFAATYQMVPDGEMSEIDTSFTIKSVALTITGNDPDNATQGKVTLSMADVAGTSKGNQMTPEIAENMAAALDAGFTMDSDFSFGAIAMDVDVTEATGPTKLIGGIAGGSLNVAIDREKVSYGTAFNGGSFTVSGAEIPFPEVVMGFAETAFSVLLPVSKSETPQDFAFVTKLVDFTISEDVWGLVDPEARLARDPATFIVDVKGTGLWTVDIMDPAVQVDGMEPPGELNSLDLTQVLLKAAGAEVAATGALTFDNSDLVTFQGMPAPTGSVNFTIKGVNALIDNLIAIGVVPEDQAMGARMMLGMFARPGTGPDELTSQIEFRDGGIFANGQQIQ